MTAFRASIDLLRLAVCAAAAIGIAIGGAQANTTDKKPSKFYEDALVRYNDKDYKGALLQLKNELEVNPDNLPARVLAGRIMLQGGLGPGAELQFKLARKNGADDDLVLEPLGQAYLQQQKFHEIYEEIRPGNRAPKIEASIRLLLGNAHFIQRDYSKAGERYREALNLMPENDEALLGLAQVARATNKLDDARKYNARALNIAPDKAELWFFEGQMARSDGNREVAIRHFNRALDLDPDFLEARLNRAASLVELARFKEAEPDIDKGMEVTPHDPRVNYLKSIVLAKRGEGRKAVEVLQNAALNIDRIDPQTRMADPTILLAAGIIAFSQQKVEDAYTYLNAYHEQVPSNPAARKVFARVLIARGNLRRAVDLVEPMLNVFPKDAELLGLLGDAYMRLGQHQAASELIERAAALMPDRPGVRMQLGLSRLSAGKEAEGIAALNEAMDMQGEARRAAMMLAMVHLQNGRNEEALATAERLIKLQGEDAYGVNLKGSALMRLGREDEAQKSFEQALKLDPQYKPAKENLAALAIQRRDVEDAKKRYRRILEEYPNDTGAMIALSNIAEAEGRIDAAVEWLNAVRKRDIKLLEPQLRLVQLYIRQKKPTEALQILAPLEEANPRNLAVLIARGMAERDSGDPAKAVITYRKASNVAARTAPELMNLATLQLQVGDEQGTRWSLEAAQKLAPGNAVLISAMAELEAKAGNTEKALALAQKIEEAQPQSNAAATLRGDIYMRAKRYPEAVSAYSNAFNMQPNTNLAVRMHRALMRAGRVNQAIGGLEDWSAANPNNGAVEQELAVAYTTVGEYKKAIAKLETLIRALPRDASIANNLAWLYQKTGDSKARQAAEYAYKLAPESPSVLDTLGWILVAEGEAARGLQLLREAFTRDSSAIGVRYHIAFALAKLGRNDEALRELEEALKGNSQFTEAKEARDLLEKLRGG